MVDVGRYYILMADKLIDKIKHLVEIEEDVFAVFTINSSGELSNFTIAKNTGGKDILIKIIYANFRNISYQDNKLIFFFVPDNELLGKVKWRVIEYEKIRILQIIEQNNIVIVLIKSNTSLDETVDNILGYYYEEEDDIPKSLF